MGADYVLLLNQDAKVAPLTVKELVALLEKHPDFGIVSPLHLDYQGGGINPKFLPYIQEDLSLISDAFLGRLGQLYEVPFANAAAWLVKRQVFERVGGFDPLFFMYGEDNDYCQRAQYHGFKVGLAPKVLINHQHGGAVCKSNTLREHSHRLFGQAVNLLKRPQRRFVRNIMALLVTWLRMAMYMLIEPDFKRFVAHLLSLLRALSNLHHIWRHYRLCKGPEGPWI
jgi:GT2 family glycosyltransferase